MSYTKNKPKFTTLPDLITKYDLFLLDIWGVVKDASGVYPGAVEAVNHLVKQKKVHFVSNTPSTSLVVANEMQSYGFDVGSVGFTTAGDMALDFVRNVEGRKVYYLGNEGVMRGLWNATKKVTSLSEADLFVISHASYDSAPSESVLSEFRRAIELGIPAVCPNNDRIAPSGNRYLYCAGYFAEQFEKMGGRVNYFGKPFKDVFAKALSFYPDIPLNCAVMIGDSIDTDILGASSYGIDCALVLTGNMQLAIREKMTELLSVLSNLCDKVGAYPNYCITAFHI